MNKAVIYISGTTNENSKQYMIVEVPERYSEKHEYEIVALLVGKFPGGYEYADEIFVYRYGRG